MAASPAAQCAAELGLTPHSLRVLGAAGDFVEPGPPLRLRWGLRCAAAEDKARRAAEAPAVRRRPRQRPEDAALVVRYFGRRIFVPISRVISAGLYSSLE